MTGNTAREDRDIRILAESIRRVLGDLNDEEALAIAYAQHPEVTRVSIAHKNTAARGPSIALGLVKRGKVSPELGAKIAGMDLRNFLKHLSRHKVPVVEAGTWATVD